MRTRTGYSMGVWLTAVLLVALAVGCGDNHKGGSGNNVPATIPATIPTATTVTSVTPLDKATGVPVNTKIITATFSQAMDLSTVQAGFTLACGGATTGTVPPPANGNVFTLPVTSTLPVSTLCTATIATTVKNAAGSALDKIFTWTFTTGVTLDTTKPLVTLTAPLTTIPGPTLAVPTNTAITAVFNEDMAPTATASFTLTCATCVLPPTGTVSYAVGSRTAIFTPTAVLEAGKTYTATIKGTGVSPATDLALNPLAGNPALPTTANDYVWTFTTAAAGLPPANASVSSQYPAAGAGPAGVCSNTAINATFTTAGLRMDPLSVNAGTFTVTGPGSTNVQASSVVLDGPTGLIATFTPQNALTSGVLYTATIKGGATGVKDLAIPGNPMGSDFSWSFTAGPATANCAAPQALGTASAFGFFSSAALTNEGPFTVITGDAMTTGVATSIVGFHDGAVPPRSYDEICPAGLPKGCGLVTGTIYASNAPIGDPAGVGTTALAAAADAKVAFNNLGSLPGGLKVETCAGCGGGLPGELGGRTLPPGVYLSTVGTYDISGVGHTADGDLTLDAQGNANAVWVFQAPGGLTVGVTGAGTPIPPVKVLLIKGAQAKNVFWYVPAGAIINTGSTMVGTMISTASITFGTAGATTLTTLDGRALVLVAGATMVNTVINVPAP